MLKEYIPVHIERIEEYRIVFSHGRSGYSFPCDKQGKLKIDDDNEDARANYEWCLKHPEKFPHAFNKIVDESREWNAPAQGTCECGEVIVLSGRYYGADTCPGCGRWYNAFGQELNPPEMWGEPFDEV